VKITVDFDVCESNAVCMQFAPEVFDISDDDLLVILVDEVAPSQEKFVSQAARRCPRQAITLS
jgi:ferredoxin